MNNKVIRLFNKIASLFFFSMIFTIYSCKNKIEKCCASENMVLFSHDNFKENNKEVDVVTCKGEENARAEFRFINKKIDTKLIMINDSLYKTSKYDAIGNENYIDTLFVKDKKIFRMGWEWQKDKSKMGERIILREYFRIKNSSVMNQEKVFYENKINMDSSFFYTFENKDSDNYRLNIYLPLYMPENVLNNISVVLKLSDDIKEDFGNIDEIKKFDVFLPRVDSGVYWILPKKRMKGFIELFSIIDSTNGEYFHKKIYINK
ncbi:MAG: hypothetical protein RBT46_07985 [Weeksellaceae bacterium]|jgi:hypothetical protein|nr:hypothetical protein [Weeksellaceae bacterium]